MRNIRLGRTGVNVAPVALGTWSYGGPNMSGDLQVGWAGHDDDRARAAMTTAWERGIRHWDTADTYGNGRSEQLIGSMWGDIPRADIFLASKVGWIQGPYPHLYHPDQIRTSMENTLSFLGVDHVDLYYLHHCNFGDDEQYLDDALELVHRFRDEGKIRFVGLSDWDSSKVARLFDRVDPDVVQVYRNAMDDTYETSGLRARVEAADAGAVFFGALRQGLLTGKFSEPPSFGPGDVRNRTDDFQDQALIDRILKITNEVRRRFSESTEPVLHALFESILTDAPTGCTLVGLRDPGQVESACAAAGRMSVEDAEWVRAQYERKSHA